MKDIINAGISFRAAVEADRELLFRIYASTRAHEMALLSEWTDQMKLDFLVQQFHAQDTFYHQVNPDAAFLVVMIHTIPCGRLYLKRKPGNLHIIDISLLPENRNQGIGTTILQALLHEVTEHEITLTIEVERFNPALHWYERLGFTVTEDPGSIHLGMTYHPVKTVQ